MKTWADFGGLLSCRRELPNGTNPVPISNTIRSLSAVRISTQEVCPPTSILSLSGVGNEPRTPQNLIICSAMMY